MKSRFQAWRVLDYWLYLKRAVDNFKLVYGLNGKNRKLTNNDEVKDSFHILREMTLRLKVSKEERRRNAPAVYDLFYATGCR